jgi:hypothetical protein
MTNNGDSPATKKDLVELETKLEANFGKKLAGMEAKLEANFDKKLGETEGRLVEQIRDSQTEILLGFEKFQTANSIRMRKLEADQSNLDLSSSMRLQNLEERVLEIEKKLVRGQN